MAPKKTGASAKRPAEAAPAEEPASKRLAATLKRHSVSQSLYNHVAEILENPLAENLSQDSREMLLAALPYSLCVPSDERQEFQEVTVKMMSQLMDQIVATMHVSLDAENEKVKDAEAKHAHITEQIDAAEVAVKEAQSVTACHQSEFDAICSTTLKAQEELTKAKTAKKAGDATLAAAQNDKESFEAAVADEFEKLKSGTGEATSETLFNRLGPLLLKLDLDTSLRSAIKPALLKGPESRGLFDGKVVEELEKSFAAKIQKIVGDIDHDKTAAEARASEVTDAERKVAEAESVQRSASDALDSAKASQKEAQAILKAAKASLTEYKPEYKKATEARDQLQSQIQCFMDVNAAAFTSLRDKISARKRKEMAAAAAAAAEAETMAAKAAAEAEATAAQAAAAKEVAAATETPASAAEPPEVAAETSVEEVSKAVEAPAVVATAGEVGGA